MTENQVFKPNEKLIQAYWIISTFVFFIAIIITIACFLPIFLSEEPLAQSTIIAAIVIGSIELFIYLLSFLCTFYYYKSLEYELTPEEVVVRKGFIFQRMHTLPLRALTNITIYRGITDRLLGLGTLKVHTAGYSGTSSAEVNISGLIDYQKIHDQIVAKTKKFKSMTPKASIEEEEEEEKERITFKAEKNLQGIFEELKEIKKLLKENL
ncbi:MAG: PH domain-containing protein [Candidatus Heimdallarchaeota archaeon]|nr:PH domain-containing protein [Candidatus Heimdallarchaeota archaeon]